MNTKRLVADALCAAIYVVLASLLGLSLGPMKISLDGFSIILGSMLFGPIDGLLVGLLGNFLSQLLGPYGLSVTTILWMIPPGILGLIVGRFARQKDNSVLRRKAAIVVFLGLLAETTVTTGVMWVDCQVYQYSFIAYSPYIVWRYAADIVKAVVYTVAVPPLVRILRRLDV